MAEKTPSLVDASPTKRFFVEMLTRDIALDDAVLDLLDNCVDGVLRQTRGRGPRPMPYEGYWARIFLSSSRFAIEDNCGGIEDITAREYAFRMGRREDDRRDRNLPTVGAYGIGMKRAIFKLGCSAKVFSKTPSDAFVVTIAPTWLEDDTNWDLPIKATPKSPLDAPGTELEVKDLHSSVRSAFAKDSAFHDTLRAKIASHYGFIIQKGFRVELDGEPVSPKPLRFLAEVETLEASSAIAPYFYEGKIDGVSVKVAVGFYKPMPSPDEADEEQETRRTAETAGWTVLCNDRVVLYCDKTLLTGWGEAGVPGFHSQFIGITGVAEFHSNDPLKLPITTTKRGIDASSDVYLYVKNFMREGMKLFTDYTNRWKKDPSAERQQARKATAVSLAELEKTVPKKHWRAVRGREHERRYIPRLPEPRSTTTDKIIRFSKPLVQVRRVSEHLFGDPDKAPGEVGSAAFDAIHRAARK